MTNRSALLLSVRPRFAAAILAGTKTVELRRRPVLAPAGTPLAIYASSPTMAVVGTATLVDVVVLTPHTAWRRYRHTLGLTWPEFREYLHGVPFAHLLRLDDVKDLEPPLTLPMLRGGGAFRPPQSFRYVAASDPAALRRLVER